MNAHERLHQETPCDDPALVEDACQGNQSAFARLVECNQEKLFASMFKFLGCRTDAEEAVQEAFIRAFTRIDSFKRESKFSTWLYRIAFNTAVRDRQRQRRAISLDEFPGLQGSGGDAPAADERILRHEEIQSVHQALEQLSDDHRAILVLREMDDLAYQEIAEVLDISVGTVRSRLARARGRLREVIEALHQSLHG